MSSIVAVKMKEKLWTFRALVDGEMTGFGEPGFEKKIMMLVSSKWKG